MTTPLDFRKALVKAIWSCIVEASSMNVVMSGPDVNAAMDAYSAAIEAEARAPLEFEITRLRKIEEAARRLADVVFAEAQAEPFILPLRGMRAASDLRAALAGGSE